MRSSHATKVAQVFHSMVLDYLTQDQSLKKYKVAIIHKGLPYACIKAEVVVEELSALDAYFSVHDQLSEDNKKKYEIGKITQLK